MARLLDARHQSWDKVLWSGAWLETTLLRSRER